MLFAKDNSPSEIAALPPRWVRHCARENTGRLVIIAAGTMRPISLATAPWKLEPFPSQGRAGQCARASNTRQDCEMRSRLAMRQLAICSRSGMNFAHTVNASYMQALRPCSIVGGFCQRKTRERDQTAPTQASSQNVSLQSKSQICYLFGRRRIRRCARHPQSRPHALCHRDAQTLRQLVRQ